MYCEPFGNAFRLSRPIQFVSRSLLHGGPCRRLRLLVGLSGLEPPTSRLSGVRSNRLSYKPIFSRLRGYPCFFSHNSRTHSVLHRAFAFRFPGPLFRGLKPCMYCEPFGNAFRLSRPIQFLSRSFLHGGPCRRLSSAGGDKRDRTVDLLLAKQALSQLSYTPISEAYSTVWSFSIPHLKTSHDPREHLSTLPTIRGAFKIKQRFRKEFSVTDLGCYSESYFTEVSIERR